VAYPDRNDVLVQSDIFRTDIIKYTGAEEPTYPEASLMEAI
jgi:hypothetical protein